VRTPLLFDDRDYPMTMQLPYAARRIVKAVRRRNRVKVIDWRWNIVVGLWRLIPNWLWVRLPVKVDSIASPAQAHEHREEIEAEKI